MTRDRAVFVLAEDILEVQVDDPQSAQYLAKDLRSQGQWQDVVAGMDRVAVQFDLTKLDPEIAIVQLSDARSKLSEFHDESSEIHDLPIVYGGEAGPDLEMVCRTLGLDRTSFIDRHAAPIYHVDMIGFTPGFAYCSGLDARLDHPRLERPRSNVRAGSIGISGEMCGLYALDGPGGWPLIGRTSAILFDASQAEPFRLNPGDRIRFVPQ